MMMAQSKEKKTTTINIDKINGIENENEIDGFIITDEVKERFSSVNLGLLKAVKNAGIDFTELTKGINVSTGIHNNLIQSIGTQIGLGLGTWFTPEMHEAMRLFGERMREKQAIEVDRYNNKTHLGMSKIHGFDYLLLTEKEKSDFFKFVIFNFDREDERWRLSVLGFIESITDREWQDWGKKYYTLQDKISNDGVEDFKKQLSTPPAPKVKDKIKGKAGAPKKEPNEWHDKIYKEYLRLTVTNPTTISISLAKGRLIKTIYKDFFKDCSTDESKMARLNTIIRTQSNNN